MLNVDDLEKSLKKAMENVLVPGIEALIKQYQPHESELGNTKAKAFADGFKDMIVPSLAALYASAIDYYVKNAQIFGTIITVGSPTTQTASINSTSVPTTNGAIPNTLGIK